MSHCLPAHKAENLIDVYTYISLPHFVHFSLNVLYRLYFGLITRLNVACSFGETVGVHTGSVCLKKNVLVITSLIQIALFTLLILLHGILYILYTEGIYINELFIVCNLPAINLVK